MHSSSAIDVIVLGAGMVGLTVANLCAQHNLSVAVVDRIAPLLDWNKSSYDVRVSAINRASQKILESIEAWETIVQERVTPYSRMEVWEALGYGELHFDAHYISESNLGHIIENRIITKALWETLHRYTNVTFHIPNSPKAVLKKDNAIFLELDKGERLNAKLLVGADGAYSWLREIEKIDTKVWDYHQKALVATVTTELPHENTAWQRFLETGPLAFLPLNDPNVCSIVWSTSEAQAQTLLDMTTHNFCKELAFHFDHRLGKVISASDRACFPLVRRHAQQYISERVALVGDAAHVIHPFAGLGVNLGVSDAKALIEALEYAKQNDYNIGDHLVLRRYERQRRTEVLAVMTALEAIKRSFDVKSSSFALLRSEAVNFIDRSGFLKNALIRVAMGA